VRETDGGGKRERERERPRERETDTQRERERAGFVTDWMPTASVPIQLS